MGARLYDSVLRIGGEDDRAYAATDPTEYFAEASEAFFGTNDFYPFVRAELRRHDPGMYALLEKLWRRP
jgi:Mlc titration factor MtfA (ptsG expression regulator)